MKTSHRHTLKTLPSKEPSSLINTMCWPSSTFKFKTNEGLKLLCLNCLQRDGQRLFSVSFLLTIAKKTILKQACDSNTFLWEHSCNTHNLDTIWDSQKEMFYQQWLGLPNSKRLLLLKGSLMSWNRPPDNENDWSQLQEDASNPAHEFIPSSVWNAVRWSHPPRTKTLANGRKMWSKNRL